MTVDDVVAFAVHPDDASRVAADVVVVEHDVVAAAKDAVVARDAAACVALVAWIVAAHDAAWRPVVGVPRVVVVVVAAAAVVDPSEKPWQKNLCPWDDSGPPEEWRVQQVLREEEAMGPAEMGPRWALVLERSWPQNLYPWDAREHHLGLVEAQEQQVLEPERLPPELDRVVVETEP